jgi:hypothetical protein
MASFPPEKVKARRFSIKAFAFLVERGVLAEDEC